MAPKKAKRQVKHLDPPHLKKGRLTKDDITCSICCSIFLDPVTFPCNHTVCRSCYIGQLAETLCCPFCRYRISTWSRSVWKNDNFVDKLLLSRIELEYPDEIAARKREQELEELGKDQDDGGLLRPPNISQFLEDDEDENDVPSVRDCELSKPGEIAKDLEAIYRMQREDLEKERERDIQASQDLISQLIEENEIEVPVEPDRSQIEADYLLAQKLQEELAGPQIKSMNFLQTPPQKESLLTKPKSSQNKSKKRGRNERDSKSSKNKRNRTTVNAGKSGSQSLLNYFPSTPSSSQQASESTQQVPGPSPKSSSKSFAIRPDSTSRSSPLKSQSDFYHHPASQSMSAGIPSTFKSKVESTFAPTLSRTFSPKSPYTRGILNKPGFTPKKLESHESKLDAEDEALFEVESTDSDLDEGTSPVNAILNVSGSSGSSTISDLSFRESKTENNFFAFSQKILAASNDCDSNQNFVKRVTTEEDDNMFDSVLELIDENESQKEVKPDINHLEWLKAQEIFLERKRQEKEDEKLAQELQVVYDSRGSVRGKAGRDSERYPLRKWISGK